MKAEKSNNQHLRDILLKIEGLLPTEGGEALEFLDALEGDIDDKDDEIRRLKDEVKELEDAEPDEGEYENTEEFGLDTFHWKLDGGNIVITDLVEKFVESVKKKYAMLPA